MAKTIRGPFLWIPGDGVDAAALARLRRAFPRPETPMGEAWFLGERREMYVELLGDLGAISTSDLQRPLAELASGTRCFGPLEEWRRWYPYLLAQLIPRSHESSVHALLELLVTGFVTQHPRGLDDEPYAGFRRDVLDTLGRCLMDPVCWPDGRIDVWTCLDKYFVESVGVWFWSDASRKLSASLFFCLKYLEADEVGPWLRSVLAIDSPQWRAQLIAWFVGAHPVLTGAIRQPSDFNADGGPQIDWDWSHCLTGDYSGDHRGRSETCEFIRPANRERALQTMRDATTERMFSRWLEDIGAHQDLEVELADLPFRFFDLYGRKD